MAAPHHTLLLPLVVLLLGIGTLHAHGRSLSQATDGSGSSPGPGGSPAVPLGPVAQYTWRVTLGSRAPDCFERPVLLVNDQFQLPLEVTQGDLLEILVINDIPEDYPSVSEGLSFHWHGFSMIGSPYYDGVSYASQCPIPPGGNMTYRFQVNEPPGTYVWHGHSGAERTDGLSGPLIVRPKPGSTALYPPYDEERTLLLTDWYHTQAAALAMSLNRPFDAAKVTNTSGAWSWADNPQSLLLNGHGFYQDCALGPGGNMKNITCDVTSQWVPKGRSVQNPFAAATNPGCSHQNFTVEAGKTYLFRIINGATLTYQTVCFDAHTVTIVAADAVPVEPLEVECVDINSGQRYDVLLKADQAPGNYWVSSHVQFRPGSPSGYGVLRYAGADNSTLPTDPLPQPGEVAPWSQELLNSLAVSSQLKSNASAGDASVADTWLKEATMEVPEPTVKLFINLTQPLLPTGQLRWALNNVAYTKNPPCTPLLDLVSSDPNWATQHQVAEGTYNSPDYSSSNLGIQQGPGTSADVFISGPNSGPSPIKPVAGTHVIPLDKGAVVEVVLQNMPANANNGDYRPGVGANRTAMEQASQGARLTASHRQQ
ncbi:hypothetical protein N2152v2_000337 [Parachlorella kessleri]